MIDRFTYLKVMNIRIGSRSSKVKRKGKSISIIIKALFIFTTAQIHAPFPVISIEGESIIEREEWDNDIAEKEIFPREMGISQDEVEINQLKEKSPKDINTIILLIGEMPTDDRNSNFAPVFKTEQEDIFNTNIDLSLLWVGYKLTARCIQRKFPWRNTTLSETVIGSFLYASGTNFGFAGGILQKEKRFYTNYISEIISLKCSLPWSTSFAFSLDSRQYFFIKRDTGSDFIMPKNHINIFPRIDFGFDRLTEKGVDQLTEGIKLTSWIGYGIRSRWGRWGEPPDYEIGGEAKTFIIYSSILTSGLLLNNNHNVVLRLRYKGGVDNDFLTRPRFGSTIDNVKLDVVHGFTLDEFRFVEEFGLMNLKYSFNLHKRLRVNLFFDYAHIFSRAELSQPCEDEDQTEDVLAFGYGLRILSWGGLPIWLTHGIGKRLYPRKRPVEQAIMAMTAAGW